MPGQHVSVWYKPRRKHNVGASTATAMDGGSVDNAGAFLDLRPDGYDNAP